MGYEKREVGINQIKQVRLVADFMGKWDILFLHY